MENSYQVSACTISIRQCKCFERLSEKEMGFMESNSVQIRYKKGEVICKQGSFASHVMLVESGLAKMYIENGDNPLILKIIPEGNFIGLASVSGDVNTFHYSSMAYVDTVVRQIELNSFRKLLGENPSFSMEVIEILSSNNIQIYGRFFCLTQKQAYGRLADIILCLADRIFKANEFDLPLSRKDLADLSGMSAETVIRILNKFIAENLVEMSSKRFRILDYERLKQISEKG